MTTKAAAHVLGVIGVRDFNGAVYSNYDYIEKTLLRHIRVNCESDAQIVTGGGKGVETLVIAFAEKHGIRCRRIPPNIKQYGTERAFVLRANAIVSECTELVSFWDGIAPPTTDAMLAALTAGRRVTTYPLV